jgi:hypothetical protein
MKSYEEMAECVLRARDEYLRKKAIRQKKIKKGAAAGTAACTAVFFGIAAMHTAELRTGERQAVHTEESAAGTYDTTVYVIADSTSGEANDKVTESIKKVKADRKKETESTAVSESENTTEEAVSRDGADGSVLRVQDSEEETAAENTEKKESRKKKEVKKSDSSSVRAVEKTTEATEKASEKTTVVTEKTSEKAGQSQEPTEKLTEQTETRINTGDEDAQQSVVEPSESPTTVHFTSVSISENKSRLFTRAYFNGEYVSTLQTVPLRSVGNYLGTADMSGDGVYGKAAAYECIDDSYVILIKFDDEDAYYVYLPVSY